MTDHESAKASASRAQEVVGHPVTYSDGGILNGVPPKAPDLDENKWIDKNASREKMISRDSNDKMPGWNGQVPVGANSSKT